MRNAIAVFITCNATRDGYLTSVIVIISRASFALTLKAPGICKPNSPRTRIKSGRFRPTESLFFDLYLFRDRGARNNFREYHEKY